MLRKRLYLSAASVKIPGNFPCLNTAAVTPPPFIAGQRILALDAEGEDVWRFLQPEVFRLMRWRSLKQDFGDATANAPNQPEIGLSTTNKAADRWRPVNAGDDDLAKKISFLVNPVQKRLCLVCDGGLGKTTTLQWMQHLLHVHDPDSLALFVPLCKLPDKASDYLNGTDECPAKLVELVQAAAGTQRHSHEDTARVLKRLLRGNRLVLLIDALDQTVYTDNNASSGASRARALGDFLSTSGAGCRVALAGRPGVVRRFRNELFDGHPWRFAYVDGFSSSQQRNYLGEDQFAKLKCLDVDVAAIPRVLKIMRELAGERLDEVKTISDVYCQCVSELVENCFKIEVTADTTPQKQVDALRLLSMLAFETIRDANIEGVDAVEFPRFFDTVWQHHARKHGAWDTPEKFRAALDWLGQTNEFLEHVLDHTGLHQVFWRDVTIQQYFAALHVARFASPRDRVWLRKNTFVDERGSEQKWQGQVSGDHLYMFWRFLAEMPVPSVDRKSWIGAMRRLHLRRSRGANERPPSAEIIYRCHENIRRWRQIEDRATERRRLAVIAAYDKSVLERTFRRESSAMQDGDWKTRAGDLLAGRWGRLLGRRQLLRFLQDFRPIPPHSADCLELPQEGDTELPQNHRSIDAPFELAGTPVTNAQFELFDPTHRALRDNCSQSDRQPAIWVAWYEAWAFCFWLGAAYRLPTDSEWEFACRAGSATRWHFGDDEAELENHAWIHVNSRGTTHPVGEKFANPWGLHDLYGNVWEWTSTWLSDAARALRGGAWNDDGSEARSAYRIGANPSASGQAGFRVARTLS